MSWKDARRVAASSISADLDFAGTDPPTVPVADDRRTLPFDIAGERVKGIELYAWLRDGSTVVGRATLTLDVELIDVDSNKSDMPSTSVAVNVRPYDRVAFDATPGGRVVSVRVSNVAGAAAAVFDAWGIRYRELF